MIPCWALVHHLLLDCAVEPWGWASLFLACVCHACYLRGTLSYLCGGEVEDCRALELGAWLSERSWWFDWGGLL